MVVDHQKDVEFNKGNDNMENNEVKANKTLSILMIAFKIIVALVILLSAASIVVKFVK